MRGPLPLRLFAGFKQLQESGQGWLAVFGGYAWTYYFHSRGKYLSNS